MSEIGNIIIYIIMAGTLLGAMASIVRPESGLGKEFVNGIHSIGPVFLAQAGIMAAIPIISYGITHTIGPLFESMGSDVSIAALSIIAVDMGGYQLADVIASNRDQWITAMLIGYTSGASIVYLIPVGLIMLQKRDHKYLALGAMAGLISIPFGVLISLMIITVNNIPVRDIISTSSPASHYLTIDFVNALQLLSPLFAFCFLLALGLKYRTEWMVRGFLMFGKIMDAFIKLVLAACIIQHFTGVFTKVFGGWVFDPLFADEKELYRAIEIAGYIGIMLAGTFPICYLFQKYCHRPMQFIGRQLKLTEAGALGIVMVLANIIAVYHLFKDMRARDKVLCVAFGICAQATLGDHLAFTANFQPTLVLPIMVGKFMAGAIAVAIAIFISVPEAQRMEKRDELNESESSETKMAAQLSQ
ncbi:ethanolamine utilization protein EutH [Erwinia sp. S43]|uniref:Ethanolamine utilization protein EutH n=1 Tax=Pantoea coffeiphila TaxID=1465635 RepID=A0A2S9IET4_9GAMM|nr:MULTISPECIES: ethanolamine utilization protein EutH [Erwiniaceae]MBK0031141.1 ethanolamine utilization protein EutH [Erwinia sp. S43]MBM7345117.1 ethanolamine transporter [Pantoea coffeiphila]PRD16305.1 ethanolamine utilization protein EutH [Pantoea coffeiphila]